MGVKSLLAIERSELSVYMEPIISVVREAMTVVEPQSLEHISSVAVPKLCNESLDHSQLVLSRWDKLFGLISNDCGSKAVPVDGEFLDIASVIAVARYVPEAI